MRLVVAFALAAAISFSAGAQEARHASRPSDGRIDVADSTMKSAQRGVDQRNFTPRDQSNQRCSLASEVVKACFRPETFAACFGRASPIAASTGERRKRMSMVDEKGGCSFR